MCRRPPPRMLLRRPGRLDGRDCAASAMPLAGPATQSRHRRPRVSARRGAGRSSRRPRRARRDLRGLLFGGFLILLGLFFLAREFLPQIDSTSSGCSSWCSSAAPRPDRDGPWPTIGRIRTAVAGADR